MTGGSLMHRLLGLIAGGDVRTLSDLARGLGVTESLAAVMLEDMAQRGYLATLGHGCGSACGSCSLGACVPSRAQLPEPIYVLTRKGASAARAA